jgi:hypothetical protein
LDYGKPEIERTLAFTQIEDYGSQSREARFDSASIFRPLLIAESPRHSLTAPTNFGFAKFIEDGSLEFRRLA